MAQCIVVHPNQNFIDILTLNLQTYANLDVIPKEDAESANQLLDILPNIAIVISHHESSREVVAHLKAAQLDIPVINMGDNADPTVLEYCANVSSDLGWERCLELTHKILHIDTEKMKNRTLPNYIPISLRYLNSLSETFCDIFFRIKKGPDNYQFIKRFHANDKIDAITVERYLLQGLKHVYIHKDERLQFTNAVSNALVEQLENETESIPVLAEAHDFVLNEIKECGFTPATIQLTESIITNIQTTIKANPKLSNALYKVLSSSQGQMFNNYFITSMLLNEWLINSKRNDQDLLETMAYVSLFHDITLVDDESVALIHTQEEFEDAPITDQEWDLIFSHALDSSKLVSTCPTVPSMAELIIREHHGATNGKGFVVNPGPRVNEFSRVFIVAEAIARELISYAEFRGKPTPIIEKLYDRFQDPLMKPIIDSFRMSFARSSRK